MSFPHDTKKNVFKDHECWHVGHFKWFLIIIYISNKSMLHIIFIFFTS